ncbi:hypothetical protein LTR62_004170 [Meristemomyces frigidus]|uniref:Histidine kinase n=1 Tax=Meristemomyces frigidus TaxID=1508187 RepID=A0AAN7TP21_9PEZI|nr:hypothetical protein LTR62_004170 [Meristemomyces frigidus]
MDAIRLLDELPVPCLYLERDRTIAYANRAASKLVQRRERPEYDLRACALADTNFSIHVANSLEIEKAFEACENSRKQQDDVGDGSLPVLEYVLDGSVECSSVWTLSKVTIEEHTMFCLLARTPTKPTAQHVQTTSVGHECVVEPEHDMAQAALNGKIAGQLPSRARAAELAGECLYNIIHNMDIVVFEVSTDYVLSIAEGSILLDHPNGTRQQASAYAGIAIADAAGALTHPEDGARFIQASKDVIEGRSAKSVVDYQNAEKHLRSIMTPKWEDDASGTPRICGILGITLDFTAQYTAEQAKIQVRGMEHTARMKDEFLANISHELRTPIAGLLGLLDLLLDTDPTSAQLDLIDSLGTSAQSLSRIVNDLLDYSKTEANAMTMEKAPFGLPALLLELRKSSEAVAAKKGLRLEFTSTDCPRLVGDALRIRQILHNLVGNAIKFTSTGFIRVSATHSIQKEDSTAIVEIVVEDSGIGIDAETMTRLFRPFVQADETTTRRFGGTGLGLCIARKLARNMGGEVSLASNPGQGTTATASFVFELAPELVREQTLPLVIPVVQHETRMVQQRQEAARWNNVHILLVEDNLVLQKVTASHLKSIGIRHLSSAVHGGEAVALIRAALTKTSADIENNQAHHEPINSTTLGQDSKKLRPDLIFMDCQMPVLDGFAATRQIRGPEIDYRGPIVALTASATDGYREKCLRAGMDDFVTKPFTRQEVLNILKKWLPR